MTEVKSIGSIFTVMSNRNSYSKPLNIEIEQLVIQILHALFPQETGELSSQTEFLSIAGFDSLGFLNFFLEIKGKTQLNVDITEMSEIPNVGALCQYLINLQS